MTLPSEATLEVYTFQVPETRATRVEVVLHPMKIEVRRDISEREHLYDGARKTLMKVAEELTLALARNFEKVGEVDNELRSQLHVLILRSLCRPVIAPHMYGGTTTMRQPITDYDRERAIKELDDFLGMSVDDFLETYGV